MSCWEQLLKFLSIYDIPDYANCQIKSPRTLDFNVISSSFSYSCCHCCCIALSLRPRPACWPHCYWGFRCWIEECFSTIVPSFWGFSRGIARFCCSSTDRGRISPTRTVGCCSGFCPRTYRCTKPAPLHVCNSPDGVGPRTRSITLFWSRQNNRRPSTAYLAVVGRTDIVACTPEPTRPRYNTAGCVGDLPNNARHTCSHSCRRRKSAGNWPGPCFAAGLGSRW